MTQEKGNLPLVIADLGRYASKIFTSHLLSSSEPFTRQFLTPKGVIVFDSVVARAHDEVGEELSKDITLQYEGQSRFVGPLASREGDVIRNMNESKAHLQTVFQALTGLFLAGIKGDCRLLVLLPILKYVKGKTEQSQLKRLLEREHEVLLNGTYRKINITEVGFAREGASAYYLNRRPGVVHGIDPGERTLNFYTYVDGVFIGRRSGTMSEGWGTVKNADGELLTEKLMEYAGKVFQKDGTVEVLGGKPFPLVEPLKQQGFLHVDVIEEPQTAAVRGIYEQAMVNGVV